MLKLLWNNSINNFEKNLFTYQQIRWRRKPRWEKQAKSKVFLVPERKPRNEIEYIELKHLHNNYRTQIRSLRAYLQEEYKNVRKTSTADHLVLTPEEQNLEDENCIKKNNSWNQKISLERDKRLEILSKEKEEFIKERLMLSIQRKEDNIELANEKVKELKTQAKRFIKKDEIIQAIENALINPTDHSFSIDLKENLYRSNTKEN